MRVAIVRYAPGECAAEHLLEGIGHEAVLPGDTRGIDVVLLDCAGEAPADELLEAVGGHAPVAVIAIDVPGDAGAIEALLNAGAEDVVLAPLDAGRLQASLLALQARAARAAAEPGSFLKQLVDVTPDTIALVDEQGNFVYANQPHEAVLGYTPGELIGSCGFDLIHPDDRLAALGEFAAELAGEPNRDVIVRMRHKDGRWIPVELSGRAVSNVGAAKQMIIVGREVAGRLEAEAAIRSLEERFVKAFKLSPYGSLITRNESGLVIDVNDNFCRLSGYAAEELIGRSTLEAGLWARPEDRVRAVAAVQARGELSDFETVLRAKDGRLVDVRMSFQRFDLEGEPALMSVLTDVTEQHRLAADLQRLSTILAVEQEASLDGILVVDGDGRVVSYNQRYLEMWGMTPEVAQAGLAARSEAVGPLLVEPEAMAALVERIYAEPSATHEIEVLLRDGRIFDCYTAPLAGEDGTRFGRVWYYRDVTERRRSEALLRQSEERYRKLVEVSPDAVVVHRGGRAVYANPAAEALFGVAAAEFAGRNVLEFVVPADRERAIDATTRQVRGQQEGFIEAKLVRADGAVIDVEMASVVTTHDGEPASQTVVHDVTERNRSREALRQSQEMFSKAFHSSALASAITTRLEGRFIDANERFLELFEYEKDACIGRTTVALGIWADPERRLEMLRTLDERGFVRDLEAKLRTASGEVRDMLLSCSRISLAGDDCIIVGLVDITQRKRAEAALEASEERYRTLVELSPDPTVVVGRQGLMYLNPAALRFLGATSMEDIGGQEVIEFVHPEDRKRARRRTSEALRGEASAFESRRLLTLGGEVREVELAVVPTVFEGERAIQGVFRDMTERNREEQERRVMERRLLEAQKLESLGVLAGGIAHDFNNLLVAIMGNAGLAVMETPKTSPVQGYLRELETAARRAADLARQMLAYSGKGRFAVTRVDLTALVEEMTNLLQVSLPKTARLRLALDRELPATSADATQLRQIIMNLVINAGEAIGEQEGVITLATGVIEATKEELAGSVHSPELPAGAYVFLEVSDTGSGMDEDTLARIFDPFFTTKFTGRGLGLAAVLGIVRGHKGTMQVRSRPGEGSVFRLLLPAASGEAPHSEEHSDSREWRGSGTVLLIDQDERVRDVTARMLDRVGFRVLAAASLNEAASLCESGAERGLSMVLVDAASLTVKPGELRGRVAAVTPHCPVILVVAQGERNPARKHPGVSAVLEKPFTFGELREVARRAVGA